MTDRASVRWGRWAIWLACAVLVLAIVLQDPGRIAPETNADLFFNPLRVMSRALHPWDPLTESGAIPNQLYGYLFPMGPFFLVGWLAHLPIWLVERLWMALLLVAGLWGMVKVGEELEVGTPGTRFLGALAYVLAPLMLTQSTTVSGLQIPAALLPWVVLPLIRATRTQKHAAGAARSALAVTAMGAINAASVVATLPAPAIWLLTRPSSRQKRRLFVLWSALLVAACLWWLVPLLVLGRYGQQFVPFTERARTTASSASLFETVRGTNYWFGYLIRVDNTFSSALWHIISSPAAILCTGLIAALGLAGLAHPRCPERRFLVLTFLAGVVVMSIGYTGPLGGLWGHGVQTELDGWLSPFRNIYKFDPLVRFAVAVGLMHSLALIRARWLARSGHEATERPLARTLIAPLAAIALLAIAAFPLLQGTLTNPGSFSDLPAYWRNAAKWLDKNVSGGRALLVPAAPAARYTWGSPLQEPLQSLTGVPWDSRWLTSYGLPGKDRVLDEVERELDLGEGSAGLAPFLARAGVQFLVVRNDLDPTTNPPPPGVVRHAIDNSPGLVLVASFGPVVSDHLSSDQLTADLGARARREGIHAVDVFRVQGDHSLIASYPTSDAAVLSGGPEALLPQADRVIGRATVLAGEPTPIQPPGQSWLVTDTLRRRDIDFGLVRMNASYVLTRNEPAPIDLLHQAPEDLLPVPGLAHQTVAQNFGAAEIRASSVAEGGRLPEASPFAAFDGDPSSAWVPDVGLGAVGNWIEVRFDQPVSVPALQVDLFRDTPTRPQIVRLQVSTDSGSRDVPLDAINPHVVPVPPGPTRVIRLTITDVFGLGGGTNGPAISEISIPGIQITRPLDVPNDAVSTFSATGAGPTVFAFDRSRSDPYEQSRRDEDVRLDRVFDVPSSATYDFVGSVVGRPGPALDQLISTLSAASGRGQPAVQVTASSVWGDLPAFSPQRAIDGDPATAWVASPFDPFPSIHLAWSGTRRVDSIQITPADGPTLVPIHIHIDSPAGSRDVALLSNAPVTFDPIDTDSMTITVAQTANSTTATLPGLGAPFAVGIGSLRVPALGDLMPPNSLDRLFDVPCGSGPVVHIDGTSWPTTVYGRLEDLVELRPVPMSLCGGPIPVDAGRHRLSTDVGATLNTSSIVLTPVAANGSPLTTRIPTPPRPVSVGQWSAHQRRINVGAGPSSYVAVSENFNRGWVATFHGARLQPVRLDGWRQAWIVPAGTGGTIDLQYMPDRLYRAGLIVGGAFVAALGLFVVLTRRRWRAAIGALPLSDEPMRSFWAPWKAGVVAIAVGFAVSGWLGAALGIGLMAMPLFFPHRWLPRLSALAFALAGLAVALDSGQLPGSGQGAFGWPAQLLSSVAVLAVVVSMCPPVSRRSR